MDQKQLHEHLPDNLFEALSQSMNASEDPIQGLMSKTLSLMADAEFERFIGAKRSERTETRTNYRHGYRTRRFDTTCGTLMIKVPHPRKGGFTPSFLERYQRYEKSLKRVITDAYVNGVSMGKMRHLATTMGITHISKGQISAIVSEINDYTEAFRKRSLKGLDYPILYVDAIFEKIRSNGKAILMAILIVAGSDGCGKRDIIAIEAYPDESKESYLGLFNSLKQRGLEDPRLIVSDGAAGMTTAMAEVLPNTCWQMCKVHLVRKVLKNARKEDRQTMADELKEIWHTSDKKVARKRARKILKKYADKYPKAMGSLKYSLEATLTYCDFREYNPRKISTSNMLERLNREFRRRSNTIGIFPNTQACLRLFTKYAMNYLESWGKGFHDRASVLNREHYHPIL